jgi:hypothetical protein
MLLEAIPRARILRFGYDSQWFGNSAIKQRLSTVAESLLHALRSERKVEANILKFQPYRRIFTTTGMPGTPYRVHRALFWWPCHSEGESTYSYFKVPTDAC